MGIKNHKETIKIISMILIFGFALSMIISGILFLKNNVLNHDSHRQVIAKVDGKKIYRDEFERELYHLKNNVSALTSQKKQQLAQMGIATDTMKELPENVLKEYIFQTIVDREVLLSTAKNLKIKADESVINKAIENALGYSSEEPSIVRAAWPKPKEAFRFDAAEAMRSVQETVRVLRNLRAEARVAPQQWMNHAETKNY